MTKVFSFENKAMVDSKRPLLPTTHTTTWMDTPHEKLRWQHKIKAARANPTHPTIQCDYDLEKTPNRPLPPWIKSR